MSNSLGGVTNAAVRNTIGDRSFASAGLAIHGTNAENVLTASSVAHCTNGIFRAALTAKTEVDLSAISVLNRKGESVALIASPAIAAGGDTVTKSYLLVCNGNTVFIVEPEEDVAGTDNQMEELTAPAGYAPFGAIKIVRVAGAAAFTLGTTDLDAANTTSTFTNLSVAPASVSDLS